MRAREALRVLILQTLGIAAGTCAFLVLRPADEAPAPATTAPRASAEPALVPAPATVPVPVPDASVSAAPAASSTLVEADDEEPTTLEAQRDRLLARLAESLSLDEPTLANVRAIVTKEHELGQGNPAISKHPMTRSQCRAIRREAGLVPPDPSRCGAPHMVPIYDPSRGETAKTARVCMDQYEFPNIPCEYPVVHVRANEAAALCKAIGKRICDSHEWEGACAGAVHAPEDDYLWPRDRMQASYAWNGKREKVWAYGKEKRHDTCATGSMITKGCTGGGYSQCGSNTYPTGAFPACRSVFGVFDQHGNAAEHMSYPRKPEELASRGGIGQTEMKGSWFVFSLIEAHEDDCRFRAPDWHPSTMDAASSHRNYHLGFRCCKDVPPEP